MPPKATKTSAAGKKPAAKKKSVKKTTSTKKKTTTAKKKKKTAAVKKKKQTEEKALLTKYDLHGQKRDAPDETDPLRKFYASLRVQNPKSVMAETWLMEHGLLESAEEQKNAYARFLKSKGRAVPKMTVKKVVKTESSGEAEKVKVEVKAEPKAATVVNDDDDDSDDDVPLANRKSG